MVVNEIDLCMMLQILIRINSFLRSVVSDGVT